MEKKDAATYYEHDSARALASAREAASRKSCAGLEAVQWGEGGLITVDEPLQQAFPHYVQTDSSQTWSALGTSVDGSTLPSPFPSTPFSVHSHRQQTWEQLASSPRMVETPVAPTEKSRHQRRWWWAALVLVVLIVAITVPITVVLTQKKGSSPSQASTTSTSPSTTSSSPASPTLPVSSPAADAFNIGTSYKATFTYYGSGDLAGSQNCNTATTACGFYSNPGYTAAISQALFGAAPGEGQGPACGTCWRLVPQLDSSGNGLKNGSSEIVVMANNICAALGNPLCGQRNLGLTNQYGANINVNLCIDSGASNALFGTSGVGLAVGTATRVDCSEWDGKRST